MKKIGTVTFHRAQNYGSVLQTYALQEFVKDLAVRNGEEIEYFVIDVQPKTQKSLYSIYKKGFSFANVVKNVVAFFNSKKLELKQKKFNEFLNEYINLTEKFQITDLCNLLNYNYFISGSDQIWNVRSSDFDDYFYLNFVNGAKKISYSASFGPLEIDWTKYAQDKYANYLKEYSHISTREQGSFNNVKTLTDKECEIHVDPTLLLSVDRWRKIQSNANYKKGNYIFLYLLEPTKWQLKMVKAISKKLKMPVLITKYNNKNDIFNCFVKKYDCGPKDFLSLIDNASLVITSSFHGTAFSLIYRKNFYVLNGKNDNRISDILLKTNLLNRSIESAEDIEKVNLNSVDFTYAENFLNEQIDRSSKYLTNALDFGCKN